MTSYVPVRLVLDQGIGANPDQPHRDCDVLECGHVLRATTNRNGRTYEPQRRCRPCGSMIAVGIDPFEVHDV